MFKLVCYEATSGRGCSIVLLRPIALRSSGDGGKMHRSFEDIASIHGKRAEFVALKR